jgi:hypothetical protein
MKHLTLVRHRVIEAVLAAIVGGSLIDFVHTHSWIPALFAAVTSLLLYVADEADIEQEEEAASEIKGYAIRPGAFQHLITLATQPPKYPDLETTPAAEIYQAGIEDGIKVCAEEVIHSITKGTL